MNDSKTRVLLKSFIDLAFTALGLTELLCLSLIAPLVHSRHTAIYHWHGKPLDLFLPVALDIVVVWILSTSLLLLAHWSGRTRHAAWLGILLFAPTVLSNDWDQMIGPSLFPRTSYLFICGVASYVIFAVLWRATFTRQLAALIQVASAGLLYVGVIGSLLLGQLAWLGWQARTLNLPSPLHLPVNKGAERRRVIWIVFDELSYQQVYERRYPGLQLPAFDALAATSTVFTHVKPAGFFTDAVLPSLISGRRVADVRFSPAGQLFILSPDSSRWQPFDQKDTMFQDALDAGYSTAVVGWYLPYCRIMPAVLDTCFWDYEARARNGIFAQGSLPANMLQPLVYSVSNLARASFLARLSPMRKLIAQDKQLHINEYRQLSEATEKVLLDPSKTFVLFHLPVPHLAGIYNRRTGELTTGPSTYLDNLVLADRSLGDLRQILQQSGQWDSSTIVIMGDHSWRTTRNLRSNAQWTTEEEVASRGGEFDDRPFYIVKLSDQRAGSAVATSFSASKFRALLDLLLKTPGLSPQSLSLWCLDQR